MRKRRPFDASKVADRVGGGLSDFSAVGWGRVVAVTVVGSLVCIIAALLVDSFNFPSLSEQQLTRALLVDTLLPTALAVPMLAFLMTKLRQLAIARRDLAIIASTDSLTSVMNRGAFQTVVDGYLEKVKNAEILGGGALLVVDVDHFKQINDNMGHDAGDKVLTQVASTIRATVREIDLVGRIGGEEFGVFLPNVTPTGGEAAAERIRSAIAFSTVTVHGLEDFAGITVSVGGAAFTRHVPYDVLFRAADRQLYEAKRAGRNRVSLWTVPAAH